MKFIPDTIAGRTLSLLFASLILCHLGSLYFYQHGLEAAVDVTNEERLAERILSVKRAVEKEGPQDREDLAHSLSSSLLDFHWNEAPPAQPSPQSSTDNGLRERLLQSDSNLANDGLRIALSPALPQHQTGTKILLASIRLADESWLSATITKVPKHQSSLRDILLSTTLMVSIVAVAASLLIWSLTSPLTALSQAADQSYRKAEPVPMPEKGPREVRALGSAFNALQSRVKRLVDDRTHMLAAISHDLKTPLTRLRLRAEDITDTDMTKTINSDVAEMEAMIDGTLDFLRGESLGEPIKALDLSPLLETICTDLSDFGHDAGLEGERSAVIQGRRLALKRALANLIENAVKYGQRARVTLGTEGSSAEIIIEDNGPGIPETELQTVLQPFYRLESSRNRETGGVGLGLTIAQAIISSHGGQLTLANRDEGGLRVTVVLPK